MDNAALLQDLTDKEASVGSFTHTLFFKETSFFKLSLGSLTQEGQGYRCPYTAFCHFSMLLNESLNNRASSTEERQREGRTDRFPLCSTGPRSLRGRCPAPPQPKSHTTLFIFYKNLVYKNIKALNGPKIKNILRTYEGFKS